MDEVAFLLTGIRTQRMRKTVSSMALSIILLAGNSWGAVYYMRSDGSAANKAAAIGPETDASRCMSVAVHNRETFGAGDTIYLANDGGDYTSSINAVSSGSPENPITYTTVPGQSVRIDGSSVDFAFNGRDKAYVQLIGSITIEKSAESNIIWVGNVPGVTISGLTIGATRNRFGKGIDLVRLVNCVIDGVAVSGSNYGINIRGDAISTTSGCVVKNSTIANNSMVGLLFNGDSYGQNFNSTAYNNLVFENGQGISFNLAGSGSAHNNTVYNNNYPGEENYGIGTTNATNIIIYNNTIYGHANDGIILYGDIDTGSDNCHVYNNLIYDNGEYGFKSIADVNDNVVFSYNVLENNMKDIYVGGTGTGNKILNNTTYTSREDSIYITPGGSGFEVANNIFYTIGADSYNLRSLDNTVSIIHKNNLYYGAGKGIIHNGTSYSIDNVLLFEATAINKNPAFRSISNHTYFLSASSPARDVGIPVGLTSDHLGTPVPSGSAPDIGAYEFIPGGGEGGDSGGGGGCSISPEGLFKDDPPSGTMLPLYSLGIFLVVRKILRRKKIFFLLK